MGRCRSSYFRRCLNEKMVTRTRSEDRIETKTNRVQKCCEGYTAINEEEGKCTPICEHHCVSGKCTAPDTCTCDEGFVKSQLAENVCVPHCEGCEQGVCIEPNLCQCKPNYDWNHDRKECVPYCSGECHNGKCIEPERCVCDEGYIHHDNESRCIPHCMTPCNNGICAAPEVCLCYEGYELANETTYNCEPICEIPCINSKCVEPNTCECENGYHAHDESKPHECICGKFCAEVDGRCHCLDEHQRVKVKDFDNTTFCSTSNCVNGYCRSPDYCECFQGFEKDENSICTPANETCIEDPTLCNGTEIQGCDCLNGVCSLNGTCVCLNGFRMVAGHNDRCEPHCSLECVHGDCVDPDICACENDYHSSYNETEWNVCHPICDRDTDDVNGCYNGTCIAPEICECYEGFEIDYQAYFTCIPVKFDVIPAASHMRTATISILLLVITVLSVAYVIYILFQKKKLKCVNGQAQYDDPRMPIAYEPSEEL